MEWLWRDEVRKFRDWAEPQKKRGEWECNYDDWHLIYDAVREFLPTPISQWSESEVEDLLYILARDWACGIIADYIKSYGADLTFFIAEKSLEGSDWDARWRLPDIISHFLCDGRSEPILLHLADDEAEYVRRRALQSLARLGSSHTEQLALREWGREDENQQWAQMNALWCWHHIQSPLLEPYLRKAVESEFTYLPDYARCLQNGEIDSL